MHSLVIPYWHFWLCKYHPYTTVKSIIKSLVHCSFNTSHSWYVEDSQIPSSLRLSCFAPLWMIWRGYIGCNIWLDLRDEIGGWCATFTSWATLTHITSTLVRTTQQISLGIVVLWHAGSAFAMGFLTAKVYIDRISTKPNINTVFPHIVFSLE